ncbi:hypothetical protein TSMEX_003705 [Taenia solium]|eukprot:TsM_001110400 transcript=TsM_001110400 gene=TsM_001110400
MFITSRSSDFLLPNTCTLKLATFTFSSEGAGSPNRHTASSSSGSGNSMSDFQCYRVSQSSGEAIGVSSTKTGALTFLIPSHIIPLLNHPVSCTCDEVDLVKPIGEGCEQSSAQRCDSAILVAERACVGAAWEAENACPVANFVLGLVQLNNVVTVAPRLGFFLDRCVVCMLHVVLGSLRQVGLNQVAVCKMIDCADDIPSPRWSAILIFTWGLELSSKLAVSHTRLILDNPSTQVLIAAEVLGSRHVFALRGFVELAMDAIARSGGVTAVVGHRSTHVSSPDESYERGDCEQAAAAAAVARVAVACPPL